MKITKTADRLKKFDSNYARTLPINKLIAEIICLDLQLFSLVEDIGFRRLVNNLEPRYTIPSQKTLRNKKLFKLYDQVVANVGSAIIESQNVGVTTDFFYFYSHSRLYGSVRSFFEHQNQFRT